MALAVKPGRKVDKAMYNKRLSYKNIEEHINGYDKVDDLALISMFYLKRLRTFFKIIS